MKKNYVVIILAIFIVVFIITFPVIGCKKVSLTTETTVEKIAPETTGAPETTVESITAATSSEIIETIQPAINAEKITKIGAEMTGIIPSYMCINKTSIVKVKVKNTSDFTWRTDIPNLVRFGYHFYGQDVDFTEYDKTTRTVLPHDIKPGETAIVNVEIKDVLNKGTYIIQIDMVLEGNEDVTDNFWFSSKGIVMIEGPAYFGTCQ